jgi:hypothetical protein
MIDGVCGLGACETTRDGGFLSPPIRISARPYDSQLEAEFWNNPYVRVYAGQQFAAYNLDPSQYQHDVTAYAAGGPFFPHPFRATAAETYATAAWGARLPYWLPQFQGGYGDIVIGMAGLVPVLGELGFGAGPPLGFDTIQASGHTQMLDSASQVDYSFGIRSCYHCAAEAGLDPMFKGVPRAVLQLLDDTGMPHHAVLGYWNGAGITVIDWTDMGIRFSGLSLEQYLQSAARAASAGRFPNIARVVIWPNLGAIIK